MEKKEIRYTGIYNRAVLAEGYNGVVKTNDVISVGPKAYEELKVRDDFEVIEQETPKPKAKAKTEGKKQ